MSALLTSLFLGIAENVLSSLGVEAPDWLYKLFRPLVLSLKKINLGKGDWQQTASFNIQNRVKKPLYGVWIKIILSNPAISPSNLRVNELSQKTDQKITSLGTIQVGEDVMFMVTDSQGKSAVFVYLHEIQQGEIRKFEVSFIDRALSSIQDPATASIIISRFSRKPTKIQKTKAEGKNGMAIEFIPPEEIKVHSIGLLLRKKPS